MAFYKGNSKEGIRALQLQKRRMQQQEDIELKKKKIEEESKMTSIDNKFKAHYDAIEKMIVSDTIGLVTLEDMKRKREIITQQREQQLAQERKAKLDEENAKKEKKERLKTQVFILIFLIQYYFIKIIN
jgi:protein FAM50